jgi:hypothetical protein
LPKGLVSGGRVAFEGSEELRDVGGADRRAREIGGGCPVAAPQARDLADLDIVPLGQGFPDLGTGLRTAGQTTRKVPTDLDPPLPGGLTAKACIEGGEALEDVERNASLGSQTA